MENMAGVMNEFEDWEVIQSNSDSDSANTFDEIDPEAEGLIKADYFSIDSQNRSDFDENQISESDYPSSIDPDSVENPIRYQNREDTELSSNFTCGQSDKQKLSPLEGINEENQLDFGGNGEIVNIEGENTENLVECSPNLGENEANLGEIQDLCAEISGEENLKNDVTGDVCGVMNGIGKNKHGEIEKRGEVWWKMPIDFLKFCALRISPLWTVSAVIGFAILGHKLHKMMNKKKEKGLKIRVTLDDKTSSHVLSRAARLNEAFSVVKRVPVIRPPMPNAVRVTTWPAMSLR